MRLEMIEIKNKGEIISPYFFFLFLLKKVVKIFGGMKNNP